MKNFTVRLSEALVAEIEAESRERKLSKSDVVRERLSLVGRPRRLRSARLAAIADLVGSVDGLPADLSKRKKAYLKMTGYGLKGALSGTRAVAGQSLCFTPEANTEPD